MTQHAPLPDKLMALRHEYLEQLPQRLHQIQHSWSALQDAVDDQECQLLLYRQIHNLVGSGASFGYPEITDAALQAELILTDEQGPRATPLTAQDQETLRTKLLLLLGVCEEIVKHQTPPKPLEGELWDTGNDRPSRQKQVLLLESNPQQAANLIKPLQHFGFQARQVNSVEALQVALADQQPDALLLDASLADLPTLQSLLQSTAHPRKTMPRLFIADSDDIEARLDAVRCGADGFITKPVNVGELLDTLDKLMTHKPVEPYRVLVIDDDLALARLHALILKQAGMRVRTLNDPLQVLKVMDSFNPELLLMDLYMPGCHAGELTQVLRQIERYNHIPILMLSSEKKLARHHRAISLGAEDFLAKPVPPEKLVNQVQVRAARFRQLRALMMSDSLTGLYNHSAIKEYLKTECARAARSQAPLAVVMLDIDHFRQINDRHGHSSGDQVIKALSRMLNQRLRASDLIGRYGGEEFLLVLPNTDATQAAKVVTELCQDFAKMEHRHQNGSFQATLSAGIAAYPQWQEEDSLLEAVDGALDQAKQEGRNRLCLAKG